MTLSGFFTSFVTYLTMIPAAGLCFAPVHNYFRFKRLHTSFAAVGIIALLAVICSVLDNTFITSKILKVGDDFTLYRFEVSSGDTENTVISAFSFLSFSQRTAKISSSPKLLNP